MYVRGPVGVGKSYLLYLLAAEYRLNRENHRVTYVNDCADWRCEKLGFILREFVTTFYDDTIGGKSVVRVVSRSHRKREKRKDDDNDDGSFHELCLY